MRKIKSYEDFTNEEIDFKKALTTGALAASMLGNTSIAQINKINPVNPKKVEISDFDSTKVSTLTFKEMVGQNFIITEPDPIIAKFFRTVKDLKSRRGRPNPEKCVKDIFGRTIKLLEIISEDALNYDQLGDFISDILKFEDQSTKEILYYSHSKFINTRRVDYEITKPSNNPFISLGFIEKFNKKMTGVSYESFYEILYSVAKEFGPDEIHRYFDISRLLPSLEDEPSNYDIITGRKLSTEEKKLCKFEGVVLNEKTKKLSFQFSSDKISFLIDLPRGYFSEMSIK